MGSQCLSVKLMANGPVKLLPANVRQTSTNIINTVNSKLYSPPIAVDCGDLPAPKNGGVTFYPGTTLASTATFRCKKGFRLVGSEVRTCGVNGKWSGVQPVCKSKRSFNNNLFPSHFRNPMPKTSSSKTW